MHTKARFKYVIQKNTVLFVIYIYGCGGYTFKTIAWLSMVVPLETKPLAENALYEACM